MRPAYLCTYSIEQSGAIPFYFVDLSRKRASSLVVRSGNSVELVTSVCCRKLTSEAAVSVWVLVVSFKGMLKVHGCPVFGKLNY